MTTMILNCTVHCTTLKDMKHTIEQRQTISIPKITRREWARRLKEARAHERELKALNQPRPNPTKSWSEGSWKDISKALSGAHS